MASKFAILAVVIVAAFLMFGCTQPKNSQFATGASTQPDREWFNLSINATGLQETIELPSAMSKHVYIVNGTQGKTLTESTTFTLNITNCTASPYAAGVAGEQDLKYNDTLLTGANSTRIVKSLTSPERNTTLDNVIVTYENISTETISVRLNNHLLGTLNQSASSTNFSAIQAGYVVLGDNIVSFSNNISNVSLHATNVTNITIQYINSTVNCTLANTSGSGFVALFETNDTSAQLNFSSKSIALANSSTFNLSVFGGDLGVAVNTGHTYLGLYSVYGYCDPLGFSYPLAWNTTNWTNVTGLKTSQFATAGNLTLCTMRSQSGSVLNLGAYIDSITISGDNSYVVTGGTSANVTMLGSIDCENWFTQVSSVSVTSPVMVQANNTLSCVRFNVTGLTLTNPGDKLSIRYRGVS